MKPRRKKDFTLLEQVRHQYCVACGSGLQVHAHHVTSRGAGGDDTVDNLMPLCFTHHQYWHSMGVIRTCKDFPRVRQWLKEHGRLEVIEMARLRAGESE